MKSRAKRVLISQRCDVIEGRDETRDAVDTRLAALLWQLGFVPVTVSNAVPDPRSYVEALSPDAIFLSGGNDIGSMPQRDATEAALLDVAADAHLPVFAICRGLQMLNHYMGGRLDPVSGHVATRHPVRGPMFPEAREVNSYHNIGIHVAGLGRDLEPLATADDGTVEAVRHVTLPWLGIMWHPERDRPPATEDLKLIQRHLKFGVTL